jgi:cysteine desulfurase/selenocysteine lyase
MSTSAPVRPAAPGTAYDVRRVREDFPILSRRVYGKPLVYLDNAATTQKPRAVIDAVRSLYETSYANIHRGVHHLSVESSEAYEKARETMRDFIHAGDTELGSPEPSQNSP